MIGGKVIDHPFFFHAINGDAALAIFRCRNVCAEDDGVEAAWRGIVYPLGCEETDRLQGGEIDLFGVYELTVALCS